MFGFSEKKRLALGQKLLKATVNQDIKAVETLIAEGAGLEEKDNAGRTPLACAAAGGSSSLIDALLQAGADINAVNRDGHTPLMTALIFGNLFAALALIRAGADVTAAAPDGGTALHDAAWSIRRGSDIITEIAAAGAVLDAQDLSGRTALMLAVRAENTGSAKALIRAGASVDPASGGALMAQAAKNGDCDFMRLLNEKGVGFNAGTDRQRTPLLLAAAAGRTEAAALALSALPDAEETAGALRAAAAAGHTETAALLLSRGAAPNARDADGRTALSVAAGNGATQPARLLLDAGADIEAQDGTGRTPLFVAAAAGREETTRLLLERGARTEAADDHDRTPLMHAAALGIKSAAQALVEAGAEVNPAPDSKGHTALMLAAVGGCEDIVTLLCGHGARLHARDKQGCTALMLAIDMQHLAAARILAARMSAAAEESASADTIVRTRADAATNLRLTDVFNFTRMERYTVAEDLSTRAKSVGTPVSFDSVSLPVLEEAFAAYRKSGGAAAREEDVFGGRLRRRPRARI